MKELLITLLFLYMETTKELTLESFIDRLLEDKQFKDLEPDVLTQLKSDLSGRLENHINAALLAELNEEQTEEMRKMMDAGAGTEELHNFFKDNVADIDAIVAATLIKFRSSYLGY